MKTLIWSVAWGNYRYMMQALMDSIRSCGVENDLLTFSDEPLDGVVSCKLDDRIDMDFKQYWKFRYLPRLSELDYDLFVFIDSDHYFVRKPPKSFAEIIGDDPWHSFLESPINSPSTRRPDWWGVENQEMVQVYRGFGANQRTIYSTNGGFWMCKRDFLNQASTVGLSFRDYQKSLGLDLPEEVGIAVMSHMFSLDYTKRMHRSYEDIWASEWTGAIKNRMPDGSQWQFEEYMTQTRKTVNPAIVHAMRSKDALTEAGKKTFERTKDTRSFVSWDQAKDFSRRAKS
jgi:hypothetical protein